MPNLYKVIYFPIAIEDVNNILNYISIDNPPVALELINKIDCAISSLSQFPYKGVSPKDYHLKSKNYRMLIIDSYIVFYIVNDNLSIIEIMRVRQANKTTYHFFDLEEIPRVGVSDNISYSRRP